MSLFSGKIERVLLKCKKKDLLLDVYYLDGNKAHSAKVVRVDRDKFLISGFADTLRQDSMEVLVKDLKLSFSTRVLHTTRDVRGNPLYHCGLPSEFNSLVKRKERYFVYPKAAVVLSDSSMEDLMGNEDVKIIKMYSWMVSREGLELVNSKNYVFECGHRFSACKIKLGDLEMMISLEVTGNTNKAYGKEALPIIQFKFAEPVKDWEKLVKVCQHVDSL